MTGLVMRVRSVYWSILNFNSGSSTSHAARQYFLKQKFQINYEPLNEKHKNEFPPRSDTNKPVQPRSRLEA